MKNNPVTPLPISTLFDMLSEFYTKSDIYAAHVKSQVSTQIVSYRLENDLSQKDVAEFFGVTQGMISKWESGTYNFTIEAIAKICEKLNKTFDIRIEDEAESVSYRPQNEYEKTISPFSYPSSTSNLDWTVAA